LKVTPKFLALTEVLWSIFRILSSKSASMAPLIPLSSSAFAAIRFLCDGSGRISASMGMSTMVPLAWRGRGS